MAQIDTHMPAVRSCLRQARVAQHVLQESFQDTPSLLLHLQKGRRSKRDNRLLTTRFPGFSEPGALAWIECAMAMQRPKKMWRRVSSSDKPPMSIHVQQDYSCFCTTVAAAKSKDRAIAIASESEL